TESVTYLVQRAESLMGLFFLLTCYCAVRAYGESPVKTKSSPTDPASVGTSARWTAAAIVSCLLGVGTKEVIVAAPLLVLLHDRAFAAGSFRAAWQRHRALHLGLFATWLPLAALVLGTGGNRGGTSGFDVGVTAGAYWLTQFEAVTRYLALSIWPHPLVFEYGTFWTNGWTEVAPHALVVIPLVFATAWALWRRPALGFLGAWFLAILAPTSVMPGTIQMIVEHRMYLPLAAVLTLAVLATHARLGRPALWLGLAAALACGALTARRNLDYRSELTLWADTVAHRPANASAHNGLGIAQLAAGDAPAALASFASAVRLAPARADYLANYAGALARAGRPADATARYEAALALKPDYAEAHANLALVLSEADRVPEAITHAETAVRLAPGYAPAHLHLGIALLRAGRPAEAAAALATALRLDPASPEAHNTLGVALIQLGRVTEALPQFESALRLRPAYPQAQDNLRRLRSLLAAPRE
ncbi:MAG: tetratricopeptide repeat protein, partial [Verrucomicrobia bacterium]|nr:tetratricopeptide repeat protein [Verrucomicrobiota bacterium]